MITGATNGIGLGFAQALAEDGFNLVLVGRSPEKLAQSRDNLKQKFTDVQIETRKLDLMSTNLQDYIDLGESVLNLDVSILINNAGYANISALEEEDYEDLERMVKTNVGPYVYLTRSVLPQMLKRTKKSAIIFTSSIGADFTIPGFATYSATKAFDDHFSQSLAYELVDKVDVLSFLPNAVSSNMYKQPPSFGVLSPLEAANGALNSLGHDIKTQGHWRHVLTNKKLTLPLSIVPASLFYGKLNSIVRKQAKIVKDRKKKEE